MKTQMLPHLLPKECSSPSNPPQPCYQLNVSIPRIHMWKPYLLPPSVAILGDGPVKRGVTLSEALGVGP